MALIPGLISHVRHYKAAREEFQNEAKRKERTAPLDFGPAFNLGDADMIGQTMKQYGITFPEMPQMQMPKRTPLPPDPNDYKPKQPKG